MPVVAPPSQRSSSCRLDAPCRRLVAAALEGQAAPPQARCASQSTVTSVPKSPFDHVRVAVQVPAKLYFRLPSTVIVKAQVPAASISPAVVVTVSFMPFVGSPESAKLQDLYATI